MTFEDISKSAFSAASGTPVSVEVSNGADDTAHEKLLAMYVRFLAGEIDEEKARQRRAEIERYWEMDCFYADMCEWSSRFYKAVEQSVSAYRKEPSIDAANKIISVIDGIEFAPNWRLGG